MLAKNPIHHINGHNMFENYPAGFEQAMFGMGCFWGVERIFWKLDGIYVTSVGYAGGHVEGPDYKQVCTGTTNHAEVVHVVFDPKVISYDALLKVFFENHDPTQGNRQGNDLGTQYRSAIYTYNDAQMQAALAAKDRYNPLYAKDGFGAITTELAPVPTYYAAEDSHQQYLAKNPQGYCGIGGTGVVCPIPVRATT